MHNVRDLEHLGTVFANREMLATPAFALGSTHVLFIQACGTIALANRVTVAGARVSAMAETASRIT